MRTAPFVWRTEAVRFFIYRKRKFRLLNNLRCNFYKVKTWNKLFLCRISALVCYCDSSDKSEIACFNCCVYLAVIVSSEVLESVKCVAWRTVKNGCRKTYTVIWSIEVCELAAVCSEAVCLIDEVSFLFDKSFTVLFLNNLLFGPVYLDMFFFSFLYHTDKAIGIDPISSDDTPSPYS